MDNIKLVKSEIITENDEKKRLQKEEFFSQLVNKNNDDMIDLKETDNIINKLNKFDEHLEEVKDVKSNKIIIATNIKKNKNISNNSTTKNDRYLVKNLLISLICFCLIIGTVRIYPYIKTPISYLALFSMGMSYPKETAVMVNNYVDRLTAKDEIKEDKIAIDEQDKPDNTNENIKEDDTPTNPDNADGKKEEPLAPLEKTKGDGTVSVVTYKTAVTSNIVPLDNGYIKNLTHLSNDTVLKGAAKKPKFTIEKNDLPQVLIMHTHATESYLMDRGDSFDTSMSFRSTDNDINMVAVGKKISDTLNEYGIKTIQDTTQHDYPSYTGSYERSAKTVQKYLKKYPSIKIVLDVHRDGIQPSKKEIVAPTVKIDGKEAAQIMIISGCDNGTMNMPKYMENLKLSSLLQNQMEKDYRYLTRPVLFDFRKYNQDLTTGSILLEMGSHGNTLEQAIYSGELFAKSLIKAFE